MIKPVSFLAELVGRMTLAEKIGQLVMTGPPPPDRPAVDLRDAIRRGAAGSILNVTGRPVLDELQAIARQESRLGIPLLTCLDVLHGYRSIFPIPLAEVATLDPALWERTAAAAAAEARRDGIVMTFAPMLDVCRDPRWGRMAEGPGEDPWLAARYADAKVKGFQGIDGARLRQPTGLAATAKHFVAYGAVTAGREYASVDVSRRTLDEVYLPPFRAAVSAGVVAVMPAFVDLAGEPMTSSALLGDLLRTAWGFDGVIVSDYGAVAELVAHGVAEDLTHAAALALSAGVDIDMMSPAYATGLPVALEKGLVLPSDIDAAVMRVLTLKWRLGLFDGERGPTALSCNDDDGLDLPREAARRSFVLLKDDRGALPLGQHGDPIALIDPWLDRSDMLGPWPAIGAGDAIDLGGALAKAFPHRTVFAVPCALAGSDEELRSALRGSGVVVLRLGETTVMSGEGASRAFPVIPDSQLAVAHRVLAMGLPTVVLLSCGRPLIAPDLLDSAAAILVCWFPGSSGAEALADVLSGRSEPEGRLPVTWPHAIGQIPIHSSPRPAGRPADERDRFTSRYIDAPTAPRFWFGHGLGFTRFALERLDVMPDRVGLGESFVVTAHVRNLGGRTGRTVVFVFIRDRTAHIARPVLELRGMIPVTLEPHAGADVGIRLRSDELAPLGGRGDQRPEPGDFDILAGFSAEPSGLKAIRLVLSDLSGGSVKQERRHDA
ncbi:glycoside hydrolase family 3 N-terminal domain-containing protein [Alsobacter sp. R-9]